MVTAEPVIEVVTTRPHRQRTYQQSCQNQRRPERHGTLQKTRVNLGKVGRKGRLCDNKFRYPVPRLIVSDEMQPAWWLPETHLQTTWSRLTRSRRLITFTREVLTTPDDDDLVLDDAAGPEGSPRVLLLHGLEGSAHSFHTQGLAVLVARAGWRSTVINFRSCARDPRQFEPV